MTHPNPLCATDISWNPVARYSMWQGEQTATVTQHRGVYGFYSAVIVVEKLDSPLQCMAYDGYNGEIPQYARAQHMRNWIAEQLNILATGTHNAVGTYSNIVVDA